MKRIFCILLCSIFILSCLTSCTVVDKRPKLLIMGNDCNYPSSLMYNIFKRAGCDLGLTYKALSRDNFLYTAFDGFYTSNKADIVKSNIVVLSEYGNAGAFTRRAVEKIIEKCGPKKKYYYIASDSDGDYPNGYTRVLEGLNIGFIRLGAVHDYLLYGQDKYDLNYEDFHGDDDLATNYLQTVSAITIIDTVNEFDTSVKLDAFNDKSYVPGGTDEEKESFLAYLEYVVRNIDTLSPPPVYEPSADELNILMLGNSMRYYGESDRVLNELCFATGMKINIDRYFKPWATPETLLNEFSFYEDAFKRADMVVFQDMSSGIFEKYIKKDPDKFYISNFTYAGLNDFEKQYVGLDLYHQNEIIYYVENNCDFDKRLLYNSADGYHPSDLYAFLIALDYYNSIEPMKNTTLTYDDLTPKMKYYLPYKTENEKRAFFDLVNEKTRTHDYLS